MAANIFLGSVNSNVSNALNWSLLRVPTQSDGDIATFNILSPNSNFDINLSCNHIDFSDYPNTANFPNGSTTTIYGDITLGSNMAITGTGQLRITGPGTMRSNGKIWPNRFTFSPGSSIIVTLADDWDIDGEILSTVGFTLNGNKIFVGLGWQHTSGGPILGTTLLEYNGTGAINMIGTCGLSTTINTAGTITMATTLAVGYSAIWTHLNGTFIPGTNLLRITGTPTFDTNRIPWYNVEFTSGTNVLTLLSDFNYYGTLTQQGTQMTVNGNCNINNYGNLIINAGTTLAGTATLVFDSTGTWSGSGALKLNTVINRLGRITGTVSYNTGVFTNGKGKVDASTATLLIVANTTFVDVHRIAFGAVTITQNVNVTLNEFFRGTPCIQTIVSSSTSTNYNIIFSGNKNHYTRFVKVSNCTLTQPMRLTIVTDRANKGNNNGIIFGNQHGNFFPANSKRITEDMAGFSDTAFL